MVALTRAAGPTACHIALSRSMEIDLRRVMPEIRHTRVLSNAGLIDEQLAALPLKAAGDPIVLGHLSNLGFDKGLDIVVDLAVALRAEGMPTKVLVAGPLVDKGSPDVIRRASRELGDLFLYRGPLFGSAKREFFGEITHFVFPTRLEHEGMPLVLYEALAAGVVCIAPRYGAIAELLENTPSVLTRNASSFVEEALEALRDRPSASLSDSATCRNAYLRALTESRDQFTDLRCLLSGREPDAATGEGFSYPHDE